MSQHKIMVELTPAQARVLFAAAVKYDADHEDETDRAGTGVTLVELQALERGRRELVRAATVAGVDLR